MYRFLLLITATLFLNNFGDAVKCYHCYDSFKEMITSKSSDGLPFGEKFIRCDKNQNNWNTWTCPNEWPVCVVMSGKVMDHNEIIRTCAQRQFCSKYVPPTGVKLNYCQECDTTLCNDYPTLPLPPVGPGPLLTFNINIHLNLNNYSSSAGSCEYVG